MNKNDSLKIFAYKHDGSFHRMWTENKLLKETKDYYIVITDENKRVIETKNHYWFTKEVAVTYFSKKHWFNIIVMFKPHDIVYYCNLASPVMFEDKSLKYIDYDLDVKYYTSTKKKKILDRNEFKENILKYNYSKKTENIILDELKVLEEWIANEIGPFSQSFRDTHLKEIEMFRSINGSQNNCKDK